MPFVTYYTYWDKSAMDNNVRALQAYKSSDRLDASLRLRLSEPNLDPAAWFVVEEADPGPVRTRIGAPTGVET